MTDNCILGKEPGRWFEIHEANSKFTTLQINVFDN